MAYTQIIAIAVTVIAGLIIFPVITDKQLEQENRKGAKKNVSNSTRKRVSAHSDKA